MLMGNKSHKLFMAVLLGMSVSLGCATASAQEAAPVVVRVEVAQAEAANKQLNTTVANGSVNWTEGDLTAIGIGLPPENAGARGKYLARRAAIVDAYRMLAEIIQGVQVDAETTMSNLMVADDVVRTQVTALLQGARIVSEGQNLDGSYYVNISIPLFGQEKSLASVVVPALTNGVVAQSTPRLTQTVLSPLEIKEVQTVNYTGIVVDAGGLGLEPTFSPAIYDVNGRLIYGLANLDKNTAISQGMVSYARDLTQAKAIGRVGYSPLVVRAQSVRGGANSVNPVNVVVSVEDGDRILLANEKSRMLEQGSVIFIK